jgi:hypothetical protein
MGAAAESLARNMPPNNRDLRRNTTDMEKLRPGLIIKCRWHFAGNLVENHSLVKKTTLPNLSISSKLSKFVNFNTLPRLSYLLNLST